MSIENRVVLVTGAGRGIGRAIAEAFCKERARVAAVARTAAELDSLAREQAAAGQSVLTLVADLTDRAAPAQIVERIEREWGPIEVLVNNAGVGSSQDPKPLVEFNDDFWDLSLLLNVTAPYRLIKRVLPSMIARRWGRIINIASICASLPVMHGAAYTASKHALHGLTKVAALEAGPLGVTVNSICPGVTRSLMNDRRLEYDAERLGKSIADLESAASLLGRRLEPEEIASLAIYLAGDAATAINGQAINVCGGMLMR